MIEWSDEQQMVRATVRDFIEKELVPHHRELEHGDLPPYDIIRKLFSAFGMDAMARDRFDALVGNFVKGVPVFAASLVDRAIAGAELAQVVRQLVPPAFE